MKRFFGLLTGVVLLGGSLSATVVCTPTGFFKDGLNMTAALINPTGVVSGDVDASGCNIGVYYNSGQGLVSQANVHGSNYFGVLVNGDDAPVVVSVINSSIHDIGETPLNGTQHGVGVYYRGFGSGSATGEIRGNTLMRYQKGGIVVNGAGSTAKVQNNTVQGEGPVNYIAQNGIQVGWGATAQVMRNTVTGNAYSGANCASSGGIIAVGGPVYESPYTTGTQIVGNTLVNNDVGIYLSNWDFSGPPASATNIKAVNNTITNDALTNISGNETACGDTGSGGGYQAGVSDVGNNDKIIANTISGVGYAASGSVGGIPVFAIPIDAGASFTNRPKVHANN